MRASASHVGGAGGLSYPVPVPTHLPYSLSAARGHLLHLPPPSTSSSPRCWTRGRAKTWASRHSATRREWAGQEHLLAPLPLPPPPLHLEYLHREDENEMNAAWERASECREPVAAYHIRTRQDRVREGSMDGGALPSYLISSSPTARSRLWAPSRLDLSAARTMSCHRLHSEYLTGFLPSFLPSNRKALSEQKAGRDLILERNRLQRHRPRPRPGWRLRLRLRLRTETDLT